MMNKIVLASLSSGKKINSEFPQPKRFDKTFKMNHFFIETLCRNSEFIFFVFLTLLLSTFCLKTNAQQTANKGNVLLVNASYSFQLPQADLTERFGRNLAVGIGLDYITDKQNFIFGIHADVLFGTFVKEDVLVNLRTNEGNIIANDRANSEILLRQRGMHLRGHIGKIFSLSDVNPRSGIRVTLGAGLLQHKIRIQDEPQRIVPQLLEDYKKGYDRLTNGLALSQFLGYQILSRDGRINVHIGVELIEAFTQNRRSYNYDTMVRDDRMRFDALIGFKLNWSLPFYLNSNPDEIIY